MQENIQNIPIKTTTTSNSFIKKTSLAQTNSSAEITGAANSSIDQDKLPQFTTKMKDILQGSQLLRKFSMVDADMYINSPSPHCLVERNAHANNILLDSFGFDLNLSCGPMDNFSKFATKKVCLHLYTCSTACCSSPSKFAAIL
jgi:hypothetical protein